VKSITPRVSQLKEPKYLPDAEIEMWWGNGHPKNLAVLLGEPTMRKIQARRRIILRIVEILGDGKAVRP
jgi:hypothetical protein